MDIFKTILKALGGGILILLGIQIVLKQLFGIVVPFLSITIELFGGFALIYFGIVLLKGLTNGRKIK
jgi:hypothetical protein